MRPPSPLLTPERQPLKPTTPLQPLMQTNVKPPSPMLAPEQRPLKPPTPLQPENASKTPISHPQRRRRFQLRLSLREQRCHRFQPHTRTSEQRRWWFHLRLALREQRRRRFHSRDFQCPRAMARPNQRTFACNSPTHTSCCEHVIVEIPGFLRSHGLQASGNCMRNCQARAPLGRAAWCARGRRPARSPSALRASLGASSRSPARPPRPRGGLQSGVLVVRVLPPVPSGPSGALHTGGAWSLGCGLAHRLEARPGPAGPAAGSGRCFRGMYSAISHVIPLRMFQDLKSDR